MRQILFVLISLIVFPSFATVDNMQVNGYYFGENLIVINPMIGGRYAVETVKVNNVPTEDEINSSVFEIDFQALGLKVGSRVEVLISYVVGSEKPEIYNPEVLEPESNFSFVACDLDKKERLITWTIEGSPGEESFEIEQYRWEKWVRIGMVEPGDSVSFNKYSKKVDAHSGKNLYRIKIIDSKGMINYSPSLKYLSREAPISIVNKKFDEEIIFSAPTMYQLYDEKGILLDAGISERVSLSSYEEGKYWVNYGIQTELIKIK
ncbi:MAG: hypothetical protein C0592_10340 [Marinilabiliales bacterium]|nr:MAG: hypothetical protein C0592_10340 [Marinilabiliales bacterium]